MGLSGARLLHRSAPSHHLITILYALLIICTSSVQAAFQIIHLNIEQPLSFSFELENEPRYVVGITSQSIKEVDTLPTGRRIQIISNGTAYSCFIPTEEQPTDTTTTPSDDTKTDQSTEHSSSPMPTPHQLLDSAGDWCALRVEDWWTYEICYKKNAKQYHTDVSGTATQQYALGTYNDTSSNTTTTTTDDDKNNKNPPHGVYIDDSNVGRPPMRYLKHIYDQGDSCELSDDTRQVEVRYICNDATTHSSGGWDGSMSISEMKNAHNNMKQRQNQATLIEVSEPSSCKYLFVVSVPELCKHPLMKESPVIMSEIQCYPDVYTSNSDDSSDGDSSSDSDSSGMLVESNDDSDSDGGGVTKDEL